MRGIPPLQRGYAWFLALASVPARLRKGVPARHGLAFTSTVVPQRRPMHVTVQRNGRTFRGGDDGGACKAVKFTWFNLMPWPHLPDDFRERYRSVWVDIPN